MIAVSISADAKTSGSSPEPSAQSGASAAPAPARRQRLTSNPVVRVERPSLPSIGHGAPATDDKQSLRSGSGAAGEVSRTPRRKRRERCLTTDLLCAAWRSRLSRQRSGEPPSINEVGEARAPLVEVTLGQRHRRRLGRLIPLGPREPKRLAPERRKPWRLAGLSLIGETGFEPATARPPAGCATRLRHSPWC